MNEEVELCCHWSIRKTNVSGDWCLVVYRGIACEGHTQIASFHTMNGPEAEDIQAEVDANKEQIDKQIESFINHVSVMGHEGDYADTVGILFYQQLLKSILIPACKRWHDNYDERSEQYAIENIQKSGIVEKLR